MEVKIEKTKYKNEKHRQVGILRKDNYVVRKLCVRSVTNDVFIFVCHISHNTSALIPATSLKYNEFKDQLVIKNGAVFSAA